jgi:hypothetical protein
MPLTKIPPSDITWDADTRVPAEQALFVAAGPTLSEWLPSIKLANGELDGKEAFLNREAILITEKRSRLGMSFISSTTELDPDLPSVTLTERETGLSITALRVKEWWLSEMLIVSNFSGLDDPTRGQLDRLFPPRPSEQKSSPLHRDIVRVVEMGTFGVRLKFASVQDGRPCWREAWGTSHDPCPDPQALIRLPQFLALMSNAEAWH